MNTPATPAQQRYIDALLDDLGWSGELFTAFAAEHGATRARLTKAEASALIAALLAVKEGRRVWTEGAGRRRGL